MAKTKTPAASRAAAATAAAPEASAAGAKAVEEAAAAPPPPPRIAVAFRTQAAAAEPPEAAAELPPRAAAEPAPKAVAEPPSPEAAPPPRPVGAEPQEPQEAPVAPPSSEAPAAPAQAEAAAAGAAEETAAPAVPAAAAEVPVAATPAPEVEAVGSKAEPTSPLVAPPDGLPIWIFAVSSTRGDVFPLLPASLALRDAGYKVTVWVSGMFAKIFEGHSGISVLLIDAPLMKRHEPTMTFFRMKASAEGDVNRMQDDIDDIFLHFAMMKVEILHWNALQFWKRQQLQEMSAAMPGLEASFDNMLEASFNYTESWNIHRSQVEEYSKSEAQRLGVDLVDLKVVRERRRRELLEELKRRAAEAGVLPIDYLFTMHQYIKGHYGVMMHQCVTTGQPPPESVTNSFEDFFTWAKGKPPGQFLQGFIDQLPHNCSLMESDIAHCRFQSGSSVHAKNAMMELEQTPLEDQPKLVITTALSRPLALAVAEKVEGCRMVPFFSEPQPLTSDFLYIIYRVLSEREKEFPLDHLAYRDRGPLVAADEASYPSRHFLAVPPTMVQDFYFPKEFLEDEEFMRRYRENVLGAFLLEEERQLRCPLLADAETQQRLEAFLADGAPPVCIHWGNYPFPDVKRNFNASIGALRISGQRGIIISRNPKYVPSLADGLKEEDKKHFEQNVLFVRRAPHAWLFPKCSLVITYGGRSTFFDTIRSGVPVLITAEREEGMKAPFLRLIRSHGHVHAHKQPIESISDFNLAKSITEALGKEKLKEAAKEMREAALQWPGSEGFVGAVRVALQANMDTLAEEEVALTRGPWVEGEYDLFRPDGQWVAKMDLRLGRGEFNNEPMMWFRAGTFKRIPPKKLSQPWLPTPTTETTYNVEIFGVENKVQHAIISEDGQTWTLDDGSRFVYRPNVPKACQCTVS